MRASASSAEVFVELDTAPFSASLRSLRSAISSLTVEPVPMPIG